MWAAAFSCFSFVADLSQVLVHLSSEARVLFVRYPLIAKLSPGIRHVGAASAQHFSYQAVG